jgi:hypothetical protein
MSEEFPNSNLRQKHVGQLLKTEMCKFFLSNRCGKGSRCQFAHSASEIREKPDLNRTSMCRTFLQTGTCDTPNCSFAHSERELRTTSAFFKTKLCRFAGSGRCRHGTACRFAHSNEELAAETQMFQQQQQQQMQQRGGNGPLPLESLPSQPEDPYMGNFAQQGLLTEFATDQDSNNSGSQHGGDRVSGLHGNYLDQGSDQSNRMDGRSSNQSTRAETSASVSTPEGSGDSGQEEMARGGQRGLAAGQRRTGRRVQERHCTTVMITNVPTFLTQGALISLLEDLTQCMRGAYDFFYCPWDPYHNFNLGYAIINFFSRLTAAEFERTWTNQLLLPKSHNARRLKIVPAALQGRAANLRHFSSFSLAESADPRFRPLVRATPNEALKPMTTSRELQSQQQQQQQMPPPEPENMRYQEEQLESPRADNMMYNLPPNGMGGNPMMPAPMHFPGNPEAQMMPTAMIAMAGAPMCGLGPQQDMAGGQLREEDPNLMPAMQQCWAWLPPPSPGGNPGMAGADGLPPYLPGNPGSIPGPPTAVNGMPPYCTGGPSFPRDFQAGVFAQPPMRHPSDGPIYGG